MSAHRISLRYPVSTGGTDLVAVTLRPQVPADRFRIAEVVASEERRVGRLTGTRRSAVAVAVIADLPLAMGRRIDHGDLRALSAQTSEGFR